MVISTTNKIIGDTKKRVKTSGGRSVDEVGYMDIRRNSMLGREHKWKSLGVGTYLKCEGNKKEARVAREG